MTESAEQKKASSQGNTKIMVVDDNPFNLDIINEYMEDEGFDTICCSSGIDAWKYLEENVGIIDIMLLDRMMPNLNGMELLEMMKKDPRFRHIAVVMVTAVADQKSINEGKLSGVFEYITKPFERDILLKVVKKATRHIEEEKAL